MSAWKAKRTNYGKSVSHTKLAVVAARHRRSCRRRVLVSASLLRQDGLLPSRLRSVGRRVRAGSTTRPATCSSVNKCSRVRTTIAMYASGAAANTPRSARSSCRMCSRRSPASVGRTKFRDAESFRRIADYSSDFLGRPCAAADEMTASRLHRRAKYRAIRFNRCAVQGLAFSDKVSFQRGGLGLLRHQGRHLQSLTTRPCTKFS